MRTRCALLLCVTSILFGSGNAGADIIVTEIMYNPSGSDGFSTARRNSEWVEIFNQGPSTVNLAGWSMTKNTTISLGAFAVGIGDLLLDSGEFAILIPGENDATAADYQSAWGISLSVDIIRVAGWGPSSGDGLTNTGATLALLDASFVLADAVNYTPSSGFPTSLDGRSIRLKDVGMPPTTHSATT